MSLSHRINDCFFFKLCFPGAGAVEFILCHAEVEIAFAEEKKMGEVPLIEKISSNTVICSM